jgi:hypothetical protein
MSSSLLVLTKYRIILFERHHNIHVHKQDTSLFYVRYIKTEDTRSWAIFWQTYVNGLTKIMQLKS